MKNIFRVGDKKTFIRKVETQHTATFDSGNVHELYSTFWIAQDMEWTGRLFALEMIEAGEEGIGTALSIAHVSPAYVGCEVHYVATLSQLEGNELVCDIVCSVGTRIIATGSSKQRILDKLRFEKNLARLKASDA